MKSEIAKVKYDIEMKGIEYDTKAHNNDEIKESMARSEYKEETVKRKAILIKRNHYELEIIGIQKRMLELDLERLEEKKHDFYSRSILNATP
jgi:hypothetical protein